jgi:hypothetical protein
VKWVWCPYVEEQKKDQQTVGTGQTGRDEPEAVRGVRGPLTRAAPSDDVESSGITFVDEGEENGYF